MGTVAEGERRPQCEWLRARATASTHRPDEMVTSTGSRCGRGIGDLVWDGPADSRPLAQWVKEPCETSICPLSARPAAVVGRRVNLPWRLPSPGRYWTEERRRSRKLRAPQPPASISRWTDNARHKPISASKRQVGLRTSQSKPRFATLSTLHSGEEPNTVPTIYGTYLGEEEAVQRQCRLRGRGD